MRQIVIAIVLLFSSSVFAQKDSIVQYASKNRNNIMDAIIVDGDTIPIFVLDEVLLVDKPTFNSNEARRRYFILKRKVMKVYPYAVIAGNKLDSLNLTLVGKSKRKRKKLIKEFNDYLKDEFEDEMVKLTHNEGQILSKLVYRETGMSSYDLIKNYRSGWNAFWWNGIAYFNKIDLKTPYAPTEDEEDKLIEGILNRAFIEGRLKERVPITSLIPVN
jgi:hypothetical protein